MGSDSVGVAGGEPLLLLFASSICMALLSWLVGFQARGRDEVWTKKRSQQMMTHERTGYHAKLSHWVMWKKKKTWVLCSYQQMETRLIRPEFSLTHKNMKTTHSFFRQSASFRGKSSKNLSRQRIPVKQKEPQLFGTGGPENLKISKLSVKVNLKPIQPEVSTCLWPVGLSQWSLAHHMMFIAFASYF